jgi:ribosomal protein L11 methylase PrmA
LDFKSDDVADALNAVGIEIVEKKQEEDWIALIGKKGLGNRDSEIPNP